MTRSPFRARRALLLALFGGLFSSSVFSSSVIAAEPFTLLTNWTAQAEQGGFYEAQATGLYKKAGLDVAIKMGGPQVNGMQLLLAGNVDAIMGYDFQLLQTVQKGLPAVAVAATFQYDFQGIMAHDDVLLRRARRLRLAMHLDLPEGRRTSEIRATVGQRAFGRNVSFDAGRIAVGAKRQTA